MWTWWVSRSSSAPVNLSDPNTPVHSSNGRLEVDRAALVTLAEDLEQQLRAGRRQRYIPELVDDQQLVGRQLALEAEQSFLVPGLDQLMDHGGRGGEADRQTLLTSRQPQPQGRDVARRHRGDDDVPRAPVLARLTTPRLAASCCGATTPAPRCSPQRSGGLAATAPATRRRPARAR